MRAPSWLLRGLERRLTPLVNQSHRRNGRPFDAAIATPPPAGRRRSWVHYGVMVPDLPEGHGFFNVLSIVGTPGAVVFDNDALIRTTPRDTAYLLSATARLGGDEFRSYSLREDCRFSADGSELAFGDALSIRGRHPDWQLHRRFASGAELRLSIRATPAVSWFAWLPGLYDHWSLLCRYQGELREGGTRLRLAGLCTFEYASGVGVYSLGDAPLPLPRSRKIPILFFTYQVINLDAGTQLLLTELRGPADLCLQRTLYVRHVDGSTETHETQVEMRVLDRQPEPAITPDGHAMRLPRRLAWEVRDDRGEPVLALECEVDQPYTYGLGAGYVSGYACRGRFRGAPVEARGYLEYIDRR